MGAAFRGAEELPELNSDSVKRSNWQAVVDVANEFNQPGRFTALVAFEWSDTPGGSHNHRVSIFRGPKYPEMPFSALDSRQPADLWKYADANRARGIDSVLIPHNPNLSNGMQFSYEGPDGKPMTREYAQVKARNERLVYGRVTGWGQNGPLAHAAGHDINYIALAGALEPIGRKGQPPLPPLNLVGDFGGGGMLLALGVLAGLLDAKRSGKGQVVDAAMVDGAAALMAMAWGIRAAGAFNEERGTNILDGGAPFYDTYETQDGRHVAIGAIEPQFYALLLERLGLDSAEVPSRRDDGSWPELREILAQTFRQRTRAEWCEILEGTDVCFAPVLTMSDAAHHPHLRARDTIVERHGFLQPAPAPRFSRSEVSLDRPMPPPGAHTDEVLAEWGVPSDEIDCWHEAGAIRQAAKPGGST
jgi:alpha-methylacyl-CoA racemase